MAELEQRPIPGRVQLAAVAWLRWRMFVNSFRSRQGGGRNVGSLILAIVLRLILWPVFAAWVIGPVFGAGYAAWSAIANHEPQWLVALLSGVCFLWQFIAVNGSNIAASMPTFDPASLLRFPVPFGRYLLLRTVLGLMTPTTVIGCLALVAAAIGITIADPRLAPVAFVALSLYALMNIFLSRMIAIWLERLLAARRTREIFGGLLVVAILGFQFLQLGRLKHRHENWLFDTAMQSTHAMRWLPPGFTADAVLGRGGVLAQFANLLLLALWTAMFLAGFAYRLHKQYLGEYLSDAVPNSTRVARAPRRAARENATAKAERARHPAPIAAVLRKEWLTVRRNTGQMVGLATPLIFVWLMSRGLFGSHPAYLLPAAVGYAILGPMAAVYNIFGPDGPGVQLYLLCPVSMRDVLLAKNLASVMLLGLEAAVAWLITVKTALVTIPPVTQLAVLLWLVFVLSTNIALGTLRSIQSPRKYMPGQSRQMRSAPTSRTSALLVLGVVAASMLIHIPVTRLSRHLHQPWLGVWIFGALALAGLAVYAVLLSKVDVLVQSNRDVLERELCGV